jgi:hypothetical protein
MPLDDSLIEQPARLPDLRDWRATLKRSARDPNIGTALASPLSTQARPVAHTEEEDPFPGAMLQRRRLLNFEQSDQVYLLVSDSVWSVPRAASREKWLDAALEELRQCDEEAKQEGYPAPSMAARQNVRRILEEIARMGLAVPQPAVYPTADREIAVFFRNPTAGAAVLITCDVDGSGACFSSIAGKNRRARYDDATDLPGAFVRSELQRLRRP